MYVCVCVCARLCDKGPGVSRWAVPPPQDCPLPRASVLYRGARWPPISLQPWEAAPSRYCLPELFWLLSFLSSVHIQVNHSWNLIIKTLWKRKTNAVLSLNLFLFCEDMHLPYSVNHFETKKSIVGTGQTHICFFTWSLNSSPFSPTL